MKSRPFDTQSDSRQRKAEEREKIASEIIDLNQGDLGRTWVSLAEKVHFPFDSEKLIRVMFQLSAKLIARESEFKRLISDEASGRLPSLIIKDLFDRRRKERGQEEMPLLFLLGGRMPDQQHRVVREYVLKHRHELAQSLVVSEYIASGESMAWFLDIFRQFGLEPVVSAVTCRYGQKDYKVHFPNELIVGADDSTTGQYLWSKGLATGVEKPPESVKNPPPFPEVRKNYQWSTSSREAQQAILRAREDVALISEVFARLLNIQ